MSEGSDKSNINNANNSGSNRRQRERTTFDPQEEITRLMQIFECTHHPTRYQIASICDLLNSLACRKDKKPLEPYNIQYWFKNARAALRRKVKGEKGVGGAGFDPRATSANENGSKEFKARIKSESGANLNESNEFNEGNDDSKYSNYDDEDDEDLDEENYNFMGEHGNYNDMDENSNDGSCNNGHNSNKDVDQQIRNIASKEVDSDMKKHGECFFLVFEILDLNKIFGFFVKVKYKFILFQKFYKKSRKIFLLFKGNIKNCVSLG